MNVTQTVEAVRLTRSIPKAEAGSFETMRYLVRSQRDVINWALGNAGAYPDVAEKITGTMRLDEMTEILRHIQSLTMLAQGSASRLVQ